MIPSTNSKLTFERFIDERFIDEIFGKTAKKIPTQTLAMTRQV
ncbi:MAG: hypothetical protein AABN95_09230 [Acidobacteriota bacterium]